MGRLGGDARLVLLYGFGMASSPCQGSPQDRDTLLTQTVLCLLLVASSLSWNTRPLERVRENKILTSLSDF